MGGKTVRVGLKNLKIEFLGHRQVTLPVQFLCLIELGCRVHPGLKASTLVRRSHGALCPVFPDTVPGIIEGHAARRKVQPTRLATSRCGWCNLPDAGVGPLKVTAGRMSKR